MLSIIHFIRTDLESSLGLVRPGVLKFNINGKMSTNGRRIHKRYSMRQSFKHSIKSRMLQN